MTQSEEFVQPPDIEIVEGEEDDPELALALEILNREGGMTEAERDRILKRILERQVCIQTIQAQATKMVEKEQRDLAKIMRFYGWSLEQWFRATTTVMGHGKKKPTRSIETWYGTLRYQITGGRVGVSDEAEALAWCNEHPQQAEGLVAVETVTKLDKRAYAAMHKAHAQFLPDGRAVDENGELIGGLRRSPRSEYVAFNPSKETGLKSVKLTANNFNQDQETESEEQND